MKRADHAAFGRFVAEREGRRELERIGRPWNPFYIVVANWVGDHVATLPDDLEPAISPDHRKIFHSKDAFSKIEQWKGRIRERNSSESPNWWVNTFLIMALSAYQSHIFLDSTTKMGVPDYGWVIKMFRAFFGKEPPS